VVVRKDVGRHEPERGAVGPERRKRNAALSVKK
jgi:hypothetical protein